MIGLFAHRSLRPSLATRLFANDPRVGETRFELGDYGWVNEWLVCVFVSVCVEGWSCEEKLASVKETGITQPFPPAINIHVVEAGIKIAPHLSVSLVKWSVLEGSMYVKPHCTFQVPWTMVL